MPATALAPRGVLTAPTTIDAASAAVDGASNRRRREPLARPERGGNARHARTHVRERHEEQPPGAEQRHRPEAGGEGVLGGGLEPRVEVIEGQVERGAVAQALHGDDREALGGDHRGERQAAEELHEPKNREKRCNHPTRSRGGRV